MSPVTTAAAIATAAMPLLKSEMTPTAINAGSPSNPSFMSNNTSLPVVKTLSFREYLSPETRTQFLQEMRQSLMTFGTFYIKDHGVATSLTAGAMQTVRDYFSLPLDEKKKMMIGNSRHFRGYKLIGKFSWALFFSILLVFAFSLPLPRSVALYFWEPRKDSRLSRLCVVPAPFSCSYFILCIMRRSERRPLFS